MRALRLARYTDSSKGTTATYSYDANGQRTRSIVASAGGTTSTDYVYQGLTLLSLSATSSGNASYTIDYLYDGSGRPYAGFYRDESTAAVTAFDIVTTDRGDVAELTDVSGTAFALYRYDPWGNSLSTTSSAGSMVATLAAVISARQPLRYAGYAFDAESGLYYCSARYYDPATCQFVSKDAARADGEGSAYQYCGGDPVGSVDPSGLSIILTIWSRIWGSHWNSYDDVHSWLTVNNYEKSSIHVGRRKVKPGYSESIGKFKNAVKGKARTSVFYNREIREGANHGTYDCYSETINRGELSKMNSWIKSTGEKRSWHGWGTWSNCSWFAATAWNAIGRNYMWAGVCPNPYDLYDSIFLYPSHRNHRAQLNNNTKWDHKVGYYRKKKKFVRD